MTDRYNFTGVPEVYPVEQRERKMQHDPRLVEALRRKLCCPDGCDRVGVCRAEAWHGAQANDVLDTLAAMGALVPPGRQARLMEAAEDFDEQGGARAAQPETAAPPTDGHSGQSQGTQRAHGINAREENKAALQLVPVEPTEAMLHAASWALFRWREASGDPQAEAPPGEKHAIRYRAMLAAAPKPGDV